MRAQLGDTLRRNRQSRRSSELVTRRGRRSRPMPRPAARSCGSARRPASPIPLVFCVGQLPESRERDAKNSLADRELAGHRCPATVNGRLHPGRRRRRASAAAARRRSSCPATSIAIASRPARASDLVVVRERARADPVPGRRRARLVPGRASRSTTPTGTRGGLRRRLPLPARTRCSTTEVPADGEYVVEIKRRDLPRPRGLRLPHQRSASCRSSPASSRWAGRAGTKTTVELTGWNLPTSTRHRGRDARSAGRRTRCRATRGRASRPISVPFAVDTLPECLETEPNDTAEDGRSASRCRSSSTGASTRPGDVGRVPFAGPRGRDQSWPRSLARRLDSPLDSSLEV